MPVGALAQCPGDAGLIPMHYSSPKEVLLVEIIGQFHQREKVRSWLKMDFRANVVSSVSVLSHDGLCCGILFALSIWFSPVASVCSHRLPFSFPVCLPGTDGLLSD